VDVCIDSGMSMFSQSRGWIPPDPHGAVGPETLIAVTNVQVESLYKGDGAIAFGPTPLADMFLTSARLFDPKVIYDVHRSRFVLVVLTTDDDSNGNRQYSRILVAVSKSSVPTSATSHDWYHFDLDSFVDLQVWADYPGLAVDEEAIYITNNMFTAVQPFTFQSSLLWIIAKDPVYSGGIVVASRHDYVLEAGVGSYGTYMPAMVRSRLGIAPNVGTYLVMYNGLTDSAGTESVSVIQIDSPLNSPTFRQAYVAIGDVDPAPNAALADAPQKDPLGRGATIEVNDRRALDAVWVKNQLWLVTTGKDASLETSALWIKFSADGVAFPPTLADKGYIRGEDISPGTYTFFPSLDVNSKGVAAFGFAASSPTIYAGAYAAIRDDAVDGAGTVRKAMLVKAGEAPYNINFGGTRNRWGDYSGLALDPSNEDCFWAFNEYAGSATFTTSDGQFGSWKTAWARLCYPGTTTPPAPTKPPTKLPPPSCRSVNKVCTRKSQCCAPSNKVCEGPRGVPKRCKVCLRRGTACARTTQCCAGLTCKNRKCKP
jgi:hypothetical protein